METNSKPNDAPIHPGIIESICATILIGIVAFICFNRGPAALKHEPEDNPPRVERVDYFDHGRLYHLLPRDPMGWRDTPPVSDEDVSTVRALPRDADGCLIEARMPAAGWPVEPSNVATPYTHKS